MKCYEDFQKTIEESVQPSKVSGEEALNEIAKALQEAASEEYGPGIYIEGSINTKAKTYSFLWKRPSCRQRWSFSAPLLIDEPPTKD